MTVQEHQILEPDMDSSVNQNIGRYNSFIDQSIEKHKMYTDILTTAIGNGVFDGNGIYFSEGALRIASKTKFLTGDCLNQPFNAPIDPAISIDDYAETNDYIIVLYEVSYKNVINLENDNWSSSGLSVPIEHIKEEIDWHVTLVPANLVGSNVAATMPDIYWTTVTQTLKRIIGNTAIEQTDTSYNIIEPVKYEIKKCGNSGDILISPDKRLMLSDTTLGPSNSFIPDINYNRLSYATVLGVLKKTGVNWDVDKTINKVVFYDGVGHPLNFLISKVVTKSIGVNSNTKNDNKTYSIEDFVVPNSTSSDYGTMKAIVTDNIRPEHSEGEGYDSSRYNSALIEGGIVNVTGKETGNLGSIRSKNALTNNLLSSREELDTVAYSGYCRPIEVLNDDGTNNNGYIDSSDPFINGKTALSGLVVTPNIVIPRKDDGTVQNELKIFYVDDNNQLKEGKVLTHVNEEILETKRLVYLDNNLDFDQQQIEMMSRSSHKMEDELTDRLLYSTNGDFLSSFINIDINFSLEDKNIVFVCNNGQDVFDSLEQYNVTYDEVKNVLQNFALYNYKTVVGDTDVYEKILELDTNNIDTTTHKVKIKGLAGNTNYVLYNNGNNNFSYNYLNYKTGAISLRFITLTPNTSIYGDRIHIHADYSCFRTITDLSIINYGITAQNKLRLKETEYKDVNLNEVIAKPSIEFIDYNSDKTFNYRTTIKQEQGNLEVTTIENNLNNQEETIENKLKFKDNTSVEIGSHQEEGPNVLATNSKLEVNRELNWPGTTDAYKYRAGVTSQQVHVGAEKKDDTNVNYSTDIGFNQIIIYQNGNSNVWFTSGGYGKLNHRLRIADSSSNPGASDTGTRIEINNDKLETYSLSNTQTTKIDYNTGEIIATKLNVATTLETVYSKATESIVTGFLYQKCGVVCMFTYGNATLTNGTEIILSGTYDSSVDDYLYKVGSSLVLRSNFIMFAQEALNTSSLSNKFLMYIQDMTNGAIYKAVYNGSRFIAQNTVTIGNEVLCTLRWNG